MSTEETVTGYLTSFVSLVFYSHYSLALSGAIKRMKAKVNMAKDLVIWFENKLYDNTRLGMDL